MWHVDLCYSRVICFNTVLSHVFTLPLPPWLTLIWYSYDKYQLLQFHGKNAMNWTKMLSFCLMETQSLPCYQQLVNQKTFLIECTVCSHIFVGEWRHDVWDFIYILLRSIVSNLVTITPHPIQLINRQRSHTTRIMLWE